MTLRLKGYASLEGYRQIVLKFAWVVMSDVKVILIFEDFENYRNGRNNFDCVFNLFSYDITKKSWISGKLVSMFCIIMIF